MNYSSDFLARNNGEKYGEKIARNNGEKYGEKIAINNGEIFFFLGF